MPSPATCEASGLGSGTATVVLGAAVVVGASVMGAAVVGGAWVEVSAAVLLGGMLVVTDCRVVLGALVDVDAEPDPHDATNNNARTGARRVPARRAERCPMIS
jgi:hypothetical protein